MNPAPRKILKSGDGGGQIGDQIRSNLTRFDRMSNRAVECETVRFDRSVSKRDGPIKYTKIGSNRRQIQITLNQILMIQKIVTIKFRDTLIKIWKYALIF
jgi:hypothetical protein